MVLFHSHQCCHQRGVFQRWLGYLCCIIACWSTNSMIHYFLYTICKQWNMNFNDHFFSKCALNCKSEVWLNVSECMHSNCEQWMKLMAKCSNNKIKCNKMAKRWRTTICHWNYSQLMDTLMFVKMKDERWKWEAEACKKYNSMIEFKQTQNEKEGNAYHG